MTPFIALLIYFMGWLACACVGVYKDMIIDGGRYRDKDIPSILYYLVVIIFSSMWPALVPVYLLIVVGKGVNGGIENLEKRMFGYDRSKRY